MTMRDEYRKANDAIHAPQSLLSALHEAAETDDTPVLFEAEKPKLWPRIAVFSSVAAVAAALALIVFLPRGGNLTASAPHAAAKAADAETVYSAETTMEAALYDEAPAEAPMLSASLFSVDSAVLTGSAEDDWNDEYDYGNAQTMPDPTYADVFALLVPEARAAGAPDAPTDDTPTPEEIKAKSADSDAAWTREGNTLTVNGLSLPLPENCGEIMAMETVAGRICVVTQNVGVVDVYVYADGALVGEASQSGVYGECRVQETSVFGDDNRLETHTVLLVTGTYAPDLAKADETDPMSFCPYVWDGEAYRPLMPDEIDLCGEGDTFTLYAAIEPDPVRVLYAFAELGLED